jgi:hypothetical protein
MATKLSHMLGTEDGFADDAAVAAYLLANPQIILKKGCFYFNSTAPVSIRFWNGTVWVALGSGGSVPIIDTLANIEALVPAVGDQGFPTDSPYVLRCAVAGTWQYSFPGETGVMTPPNGACNTTWIAQNNSLRFNIGKKVVLVAKDAIASTQLRGIVDNAPGATFTVIAYIRGNADPVNYQFYGLWLRQSGGAPNYNSVMFFQNVGIQYYTNDTTYGGVIAMATTIRQVWMKVVLDAVNLTYYSSVDGSTWIQQAQHLKGTYFSDGAPNQIGICCQNNGTQPASTTCELLSWVATTP